MDDISWTDLSPAEQRAIAALGAGMPIGLCDQLALLTLKRAGLVRGGRLTPKAMQLRKAALLETMAEQVAFKNQRSRPTGAASRGYLERSLARSA